MEYDNSIISAQWALIESIIKNEFVPTMLKMHTDKENIRSLILMDCLDRLMESQLLPEGHDGWQDPLWN